MKRDRNSFFSNYTSQYQSYNQNMGMPTNGINPYMNNNFYGNDLSFQNDIDNRLSKIERQLNRLDQRITTIENRLQTTNITSPNTNDQNYQNMYMI